MKKFICLFLVALSSAALIAHDQGITCKSGHSYIMGSFEQPQGTSWIGLMEQSKDQFNVSTKIPKKEIDLPQGTPNRDPYGKAIVGGVVPLTTLKSAEIKSLYYVYPADSVHAAFPDTYYEVFSFFCQLNPVVLDDCDDNMCVEGDGYSYKFSCKQDDQSKKGVASWEETGNDC